MKYTCISYFLKNNSPSMPKKNPKKTLNFKVSVNNDIPSVWFLENSWGKIILRRFGHKGQTLKRKTTFQLSYRVNTILFFGVCCLRRR